MNIINFIIGKGVIQQTSCYKKYKIIYQGQTNISQTFNKLNKNTAMHLFISRQVKCCDWLSNVLK